MGTRMRRNCAASQAREISESTAAVRERNAAMPPLRLGPGLPKKRLPTQRQTPLHSTAIGSHG